MRLGLTNTIAARGTPVGGDGLALDLQFAADKTLTARKGPTPVLTRGSNGTFVGSDGLIQTAAVNAARFDHDPVTLASRGLLIEEGRTNLYQRSENFADTFWTKTRLSIQTDATTAPDGTTTADKLIEDTSASNTHTIGSGTTPPATPHTLSVFAKKGERNFIVLRLGGTNDFFNLNTGVALTNINSPTITNYGNGWYRCTVTSSLGTQGSYRMSADGITDTYTGDGTSGIFIWGAQLEAGSFPTSYIPTTTSALARSADVCSITGANFSNMWNATEGSLFASASFNAPTNSGVAQAIVDINDTTTANRLRTFRGTTGVMALFQTSGSPTSNVEIIQPTGIPPFTLQKTSAGFRVNDYVLYVNNTLIGTDTLGAFIVSPTTMNIGEASAGSATRQYTNGTISAIRYYRKRLANSKLASLTV